MSRHAPACPAFKFMGLEPCTCGEPSHALMEEHDKLRWTLDNIYTIARRESARQADGRPLHPEMWGHVLRLCEAVGVRARTVGVLREIERAGAPPQPSETGPREPDRMAAIRWLDWHGMEEEADKVRASECRCPSQCQPALAPVPEPAPTDTEKPHE